MGSDRTGTNWEDGLCNVFRRTTGRPTASISRTCRVHHRRQADDGPHAPRAASRHPLSKRAPRPIRPRSSPTAAGRRAPRRSAIMVGKQAPATRRSVLSEGSRRQRRVGRLGPGNGTIGSATPPRPTCSSGSFDELGDVLRAILIAECGGTLTIQKRIDVSGGVPRQPGHRCLVVLDTALGCADARSGEDVVDHVRLRVRRRRGQQDRPDRARQTPAATCSGRAECTAAAPSSLYRRHRRDRQAPR